MDAGQRPSFDSYVRARGDGLLRLAWLITRNFDDAHDAVQDAFAGLLPRWSGLPEGARLDAYVYRSVVNSCLAQVRRRGRSRPVPDPTLLAGAPVADDPAAGVAEADRLWRLCGAAPAEAAGRPGAALLPRPELRPGRRSARLSGGDGALPRPASGCVPSEADGGR